jgi:hypothetical protein
MNDDRLFSPGEHFISDLGPDTGVTVDGAPLGRYAVWRCAPDGGFQLIQVGADVSQLMAQYGLGPDRVGKVALR